MTASINTTDSDSLQMMMMQMYQKINAADKDGISGISKKELSSIDMGEDVGGAAFLKSLNEQFDALDKNKNGELAANEIFPQNLQNAQLGPPPGLEIASGQSEKLADKFGSGNFFGNAAAFAEKLLHAYKGSGGLANLTSALNIAG